MEWVVKRKPLRKKWNWLTAILYTCLYRMEKNMLAKNDLQENCRLMCSLTHPTLLSNGSNTEIKWSCRIFFALLNLIRANSCRNTLFLPSLTQSAVRDSPMLVNENDISCVYFHSFTFNIYKILHPSKFAHCLCQWQNIGKFLEFFFQYSRILAHTCSRSLW